VFPSIELPGNRTITFKEHSDRWHDPVQVMVRSRNTDLFFIAHDHIAAPLQGITVLIWKTQISFMGINKEV